MKIVTLGQETKEGKIHELLRAEMSIHKYKKDSFTRLLSDAPSWSNLARQIGVSRAAIANAYSSKFTPSQAAHIEELIQAYGMRCVTFRMPSELIRKETNKGRW